MVKIRNEFEIEIEIEIEIEVEYLRQKMKDGTWKMENLELDYDFKIYPLWGI